MNKVAFALCSFLLPCVVHAQFVFGRQTISCFSVRACDELCINSTAGQVDYGSMNNANTIFTPGFEQTEGAANLYPDVAFERDECSGHIRAAILQMFGCEGADSVYVYWDNMLSPFSVQLTEGLHVLRLESSSGCSFEKSYDFSNMSISVLTCSLVFFNYCSPNGDQSNDTWEIGNIDAPEYGKNEVVIFNRWGAEVWSGKNYDNTRVCWKGEDSTGAVLPDGTYFYRVETDNGEYSGYIELLR
jgi:gliding motility-associated-like protein